MKKILMGSAILLSLSLASCGGGGKKSAASIAKEWCDLNGKVAKAADGPDKEAATAARKKFEESMEAKYEKDKAFMEEIGKEVEKCEDASEAK